MNSLMYGHSHRICEIEADERSVVSYGSRSCPTLRFSARVSRAGTVPVDYPGLNQGRHYSVVSHNFGLYLGSNRRFGGTFLAPVQCTGLPMRSWLNGSSHLEFLAPLDFFKLEAIERERQKDLSLAISGPAMLAIHPSGGVDSNTRLIQIDGYAEAELELEYHIAQSDWIEKVLSRLGHRVFHLLELDLTHCEVQKALEYLAKAELRLDEGNLEAMATQCRDIAVYLTKSYLQLPTDDPREEKWKPVNKCLWDFASKALHQEEIGSARDTTNHPVFTKADAECLLILTKTLIRYSQQLKGT